ncbi:MAG TPA: amino acid adenylation domain-containing protein [Candidatus Angelobacter sp.]|nr:amino acid adenylation domain-containing protein [Candidatus Angelobacter sp.]
METSASRQLTTFERERLLKLAQASNLSRERDVLPPIRRALPDERLRLSFAQQRLWFLAQMPGGGNAYYISLRWRLRGALDRDALRKALDRIVARHEALRTTFVSVDGEPEQRISPSEGSGMFLAEDDLRKHSDTWEAINQLSAAEERAGFDMTTGPLIRGRLMRVAEAEHVLLITMHHIIADGWSMNLLSEELSALYTAFVQGNADPLPELELQYADYAAWQHKWMTGKIFLKQAEYWKTTLAGTPEVLELPADYARPKEQDHSGAVTAVHLDADLTARLKCLSRKHGTTLYMTVLAGFAALLGRLTGEEDVVLGTPVANRGRSEIETLIGFFVNTLAIRLDLSGPLPVPQLLERVKTQVVAAQRCQDMPFERVVELVRPLRSLHYTPLIQVMFAWQGLAEDKIQLPGLDVKVLPRGPHVLSKFDLSLGLQETGAEIVGEAEYATSLYERATIRRYMEYLQRLLKGMAGEEEELIHNVSLLSEEERGQLLYEWNRTEADFPQEESLGELVSAQAARLMSKEAIAGAEGSISYEELNQRGNQMAHYLRHRGVGPEVRVGVYGERSLEFIISLLGIIKSGGVYVPLDPMLPRERLQYIVDDASVALVIRTSQWPQEGFLKVKSIIALEREVEAIRRESRLDPRPATIANNLLYVIYTSGSTGKPKGVAIEQRAAISHLYTIGKDYGFVESDRVLQFGALNFDISIEQIFAPLLRGATVVLKGNGAWGREEFFEAVKSFQITVGNAPPAYWSELSGWNEEVPECLRWINVGGDAVSIEAMREWQRNNLKAVEILNAYGPTEAVITATFYRVPQGFGDSGKVNRIPIGRVQSNRKAYVLDKAGEPVPVGVFGELYLGGDSLARGYLNQPDLTAEKFVPDPFSGKGGERLYRTGDKARFLRDGNLDFLGRVDDQVKLRGYRIELGEIERVLESYRGVKTAVVVAREDENGEKRLAAYYTTEMQDGVAQIDAESLRAHLESKLPEYMVPGAYVKMEKLPLGPSGKIDRKSLPVPETYSCGTAIYEAPRGELETVLAQLWSNLLHVERVGRHDNFFALGGHSLLGMRLVAHIQQKLKIKAAISDVFTCPRLSELASRLESAEQTELPLIRRLERRTALPLSLAQRRLWFLAQIEKNSHAYNIPLGFRLRGKLNSATLRRTLNRIVARHEILRTTFTMVAGQAEQRIAPIENSSFRLWEHDLRHHENGPAELERVIQQEVCAPFDLQAGPLIRGRLIRQSEDEYTLLLTMHHIVFDGWSTGVLLREASALYDAFSHDQRDPLPELDLQYADYAVWQREWIEGDIFRQQADYWEATLAGAPPTLEVPADYPRPEQPDYAGAFVELRLDRNLTAGLKELGLRHGCTLFMTLLSGWALLLARLSGLHDVAIGTPVANRGRLEIEGLIGFFVNHLVLRLDLSGMPTVELLLERVKKQVVEAQQHQDIPFEQLVEIVGSVRSMAHNPLFQVAFTWQNTPEGKLELPAVEVEGVGVPYGISKFDLTLSLQEEGGEIAGGVEYATALFARETVKRYAGYLRLLLQGMVERETERVEHLPLLSEQEQEQVLYGWNRTEAEYAKEKCIHELFEEQVKRTPGAVAVVYEESRLSYAELNRLANQLAHYLRGEGVGPDTRVGICVERSLEMVVGLLGVLKAGGAYVPLDPGYPRERLSYMLENSVPRAVLLQKHLRELFAGWEQRVAMIDLEEEGAAWSNQAETNLDPRGLGLSPGHLAYVLYTSGSTGEPKGVMLTHESLQNHMAWMQQRHPLGAEDRVLQKTVFIFDASVWEFYAPLLAGGTLVIARPGGHQDPEYLSQCLQEEKITVLQVVPLQLRLLLEQGGLQQCHSLKRVYCGGEALTRELVQAFYVQAPWAKLYNLYGPTEATIDATIEKCSPEAEGETAPIGRPIANTQIYVLDSFGQPVPVGVAGELYIGGAGLARGYLKRANLTAERFVPNPFGKTAGGRLYRTGDLARWRSDGTIEYLGRNDFQVKVRGFRIELEEIEARLREHPEVQEAVVLAHEDQSGDKQLVAYYTSPKLNGSRAAVVSAQSLRAHTLATLPEYMAPAAYVWMEELPLTPNGKLNRKALPAPEEDAFAADKYEAPRTATEKMLAAIWAEALGRQSVSLHDNFFALGGHSLLAIEVSSHITERLHLDILQLKISPLLFFRHPTLEGLARAIDGIAPLDEGISEEGFSWLQF